ncbi:50S ribosomal protein L27 [Candidatus Parcubacteria bacterium]|nr:MAG: 50S ribosomal protein L27 [Candidatus Parcubacteria bacterium]
MAHTKSQGAVKGNRDSISKRRGVKIFGGEKVFPGNIIVRQKGAKFFAGKGVSMGKDFTIFAISEGIVGFKLLRGKKYIEIINV